MLARHCQEESEHFFQRRAHDPRYCFELFRRAVQERDERAWTLVCSQYEPLVAGWVRRHQMFPGSGEEVSYFVNGALAKFWSAVGPEKFEEFPNLKSLLRYLQLCVASVVTDHVRAADFHDRLESLPPTVEEDEKADVERRALERASRESFWEIVADRLNSEDERLVVHFSYVVGLKPSQIQEYRPDRFDDVRDIYRIKENILARLRRDDQLRQLLTRHA